MNSAGVDPQVLVAIIATIGGIITTLLTVKYRDERKRKSGPKDRMESIFDGYEGLIKQKDADLERQSGVIKSLQTLVDTLERDLNDTKELLKAAKFQLEETTTQNNDLKVQLQSMRDEYKKKGAQQ